MTEKTPDPMTIPRDRDVEMTAEFDREQTPTRATVGTCWRCWAIQPVTIVAPPPASAHEAARYTTCVEGRGGTWAFCGVRMVLRLGEHELYVGPDRRVMRPAIPPLVERRRLPPRDDGDQR